MRKNSIKNTRINGEVQKELSTIIRNEIKDPRIHPMTSVMAVEVAPDLKTCRAYISVLGEKEAKEATIKGLNSAEGYIRRQLAQNEVESLSQNVKMGVKMKMRRGEMMGFNGCLGYDYHPENKSITVNEAEAETVRYIFDRYIEGYGAYTIAKELTALGKVNKKGQIKWTEMR